MKRNSARKNNPSFASPNRNVKLFYPIALFLNFFPIHANANLTDIALQQKAYLEEIRNHLHAYPETRWEEHHTLDFIKKELLKIKPTNGRTLHIYENYSGGLVVDLNVPKKTDRLLFRADVDALSVTEQPGQTPRSKIEGKMHACGHDVHSAILLAAIRVLATSEEAVSQHHIRAIWQRAEENPGSKPITESGAFRLISEGVLDQVDKVYGLHVWMKEKAGVFTSRGEEFFANSARLEFAVQCKGGHASQPEEAVSAIDVGSEVLTVLKNLSLEKNLNLVPTIFQSGTASNIIPSESKITVSFRNFFSAETRQLVLDQIKDRIQSIERKYSAIIHFNLNPGHPVTKNNTVVVNQVSSLLLSTQEIVKSSEVILGGEDFSYYLQKRPGAFWLLGTEHEGSGDHHSPTFNPNPSVFWKGVKFWLAIALH